MYTFVCVLVGEEDARQWQNIKGFYMAMFFLDLVTGLVTWLCSICEIHKLYIYYVYIHILCSYGILQQNLYDKQNNTKNVKKLVWRGGTMPINLMSQSNNLINFLLIGNFSAGFWPFPTIIIRLNDYNSALSKPKSNVKGSPTIPSSYPYSLVFLLETHILYHLALVTNSSSVVHEFQH